MPAMQKELEGRVAIVTGSSRGIGRAIAVELAEQGADVVVAARREPVPGTIEETAAMVEQRGRRALPVDLDVTDETAVAAMTEEALHRFGRIDILINNAGTNWSAPVTDFPRSRWDLVLRVNALGPFICSKAVLPHMAERGSGHIVNISSIAAVRPRAETSAYSASKGGVVGMTLPIARDLSRSGIRVCTIAPGIFETPMMIGAPPAVRDPLIEMTQFPKRLGDASEYALLVRQIVENPYLNGETIRIDAGIRMAPR